MSVQLDDAEFWLPAKFLMDDDIVMVKEKLKRKNNTELVSGYGFPTEFPFEFDSFSALNSPVESVLGSTKTESSDKDEFLAGLTRRLALSTRQKLSVPSFSRDKNQRSVGLTQSALGRWSASSNGSPNGPTPTTIRKNDTWDLKYAAAGQVARLKTCNEVPEFTNLSHGNTQNSSFMNNLSSELYSNQNLSYNQTHGRWSKASNWRVQQKLQQIQCRARNNVVGGLPHSSWQVQVQAQQPHHTSGSCMRATPTFVGECAGTGVFLPRTYANNSLEPQKKSGCSTVVVPTKVVQALNLNFGDSSHISMLALPQTMDS